MLRKMHILYLPTPESLHEPFTSLSWQPMEPSPRSLSCPRGQVKKQGRWYPISFRSIFRFVNKTYWCLWVYKSIQPNQFFARYTSCRSSSITPTTFDTEQSWCLHFVQAWHIALIVRHNPERKTYELVKSLSASLNSCYNRVFVRVAFCELSICLH